MLKRCLDDRYRFLLTRRSAIPYVRTRGIALRGALDERVNVAFHFSTFAALDERGTEGVAFWCAPPFRSEERPAASWKRRT